VNNNNNKVIRKGTHRIYRLTFSSSCMTINVFLIKASSVNYLHIHKCDWSISSWKRMCWIYRLFLFIIIFYLIEYNSHIIKLIGFLYCYKSRTWCSLTEKLNLKRVYFENSIMNSILNSCLFISFEKIKKFQIFIHKKANVANFLHSK
jgi:hypothetical protein